MEQERRGSSQHVEPILTLVAQSRYAIHLVLSSLDSNKAQGRAEGRMPVKVPGQVALIVDSPRRGQSSRGDMGAIEKVAAAYRSDSRINLTKDICKTWPCSASTGGISKFRDADHLNAKFARAILGARGLILERALDARLP